MSDETSIIPVLNGNSLGLPVIDDYSDLEQNLSLAAKKKILAIVTSASAGLVTMAALICRGPGDCPFRSRCPIFLAEGNSGTYPLNRQCILEVNLVRESFNQYAAEMFTEHGRDVNKSPSLRAQVSKLAEFDLYEYRINLILAGVTPAAESDGTMLIKQTISITEDGAEIEQIQEHPIWKIKERIQRQRMELLDAMGLTEKRKVMMDAALGRSEEESYLGKTVELLEKFASIIGAKK